MAPGFSDLLEKSQGFCCGPLAAGLFCETPFSNVFSNVFSGTFAFDSALFGNSAFASGFLARLAFANGLLGGLDRFDGLFNSYTLLGIFQFCKKTRNFNFVFFQIGQTFLDIF